MEHDDLNKLLNSRAAPPRARNDLAERIIHAAVTQIRDIRPKQSFWDELRGMLVIPHPSVIVATCVLLGLVVGMQTGEGLFSLQQDWSSFLDINEGGWL